MDERRIRASSTNRSPAGYLTTSTLLRLAVAAILIFLVFSALRSGEEPDLAPGLPPDMAGNELRLRDPISASAFTMIDDIPHHLLMTKYGDDRIEPADLRIVSVEPGESMEEVGWVHTSMSVEQPPTGIAVHGDYVYVGLTREGREAPALWIVDISDPSNPFEANLTSLDMPVRGLAATDDGYLIASGDDVDFLVFDLEQPDEPAVVAEFSESLSVAPRLAMENEVLFVDHMAGVVLLNVENAREPVRLAEIEHPDWIIPGVAPHAGQFLTGEERFEEAVPEGNFLGFSAEGDVVGIAASDLGAMFYDVSDPGNPAEIGRVEVDGRAVSIAVDGDLAYVIGAEPHEEHRLSYHVHTIDLSDPDAPTLTDTSPEITGVPRFQQAVAMDDRVWILFNDAVIRYHTWDQ